MKNTERSISSVGQSVDFITTLIEKSMVKASWFVGSNPESNWYFLLPRAVSVCFPILYSVFSQYIKK